ncbi:hypothetical protein AUJ14_01025 [Candidatus Micrarchaeota archaeon CG1_02_55_22]|nr:MAG: hypothetical protein AUJ14_01025 [Candidatus Micrarchaeota archaeon CG1_02_55_22]
MTGRLVDSSVIISLLKGTLSEEWRKKIRSERQAISSLTYYEVCRYYALAGKSRQLEDVKPVLTEFDVLPPTREICEAAATPHLAQKLASIDSLIYATAQLNKLELITRDNDFTGLPGTTVI